MKETIMEHDKENKSSNRVLRGKKNPKKPPEVQSKEAKLKESKNSVTYTLQNKDVGLKESNNSLTSAQKPEVKSAHVGFWSKKLQDLEKSPAKTKKNELYEFSFTDDSDASFKIKKKPRQKGRAPKKKQQLIQPKYKKPVKKTNQPLTIKKKTDSQPLPKKDTTDDKGRKNSTDKQKSITLATGSQATAFTSTPAVNRKNLLDPSNFLFLSPIIKEEAECFDEVKEDLHDVPNKSISNDGDPVVQFDQETPKIETRLRRISCRRVLRSGKMLIK